MVRTLPAAFLLIFAASAAHADGSQKAPAPQGPVADPPTAPSEPSASDADFQLPELSVPVRADRPVLMQPQAIGALGREELQRSDGLFLDDTINLIPGVRLESRTVSGGQRITIRGYGNSTNFNGTGYKAYLNGIPITDAEGTTVLDDLDPSILGRLEVIKGPASSLYGQGIGGVVRFFTLRPAPNTTKLTQELLGGSPRVFRSNTRFEHASNDASFLLNYGHQHSDGYRVHTLSNKDYVTFTADYRPSSKQSLMAYASYNHSFDQLAGQLTEQQFLENQDVAEAPYLANNGHVAVDSLRVGVAHKIEMFQFLSNTTSLFGSGAQVNQPFAVGQTDNLGLNVGGRTEFNLRFGGPGLGLTAVVGEELQQTTSFKKSYGLKDAVLGALRSDLQVKALQSSTFAQANVLLPLEFTATVGGSVNFVRYNIADRLTNSANPTHLDQSGLKSFDPVFSPRAALLKSFGEDLVTYVQVSQGYTPPGSGAVVIPQIGQVNRDLRPEKGTLFEVGAKGGFWQDRVTFEAAVFSLHIDDKLTPQAVTGPTGSTLYNITTNAGAQNNRGLELSGKVAAYRNEGGIIPLVQVFGAYTYSRFRYDNFKSDNNNNAKTIDYTDNKVAGVPEHVFDVGIDAFGRYGLYLDATLQHVSPMELTFDNTQSAKRYTLLNAKLGYRADLPAQFHLDVATGVKNALGSTYYTMAFLNANYSGPPPNVYLNGPYTPTFFGDLVLSKSF